MTRKATHTPLKIIEANVATLRAEHRELTVRNCLAEAYGEPGFAVALIYHRIDDELERRRAVNFLWRILASGNQQ